MPRPPGTINVRNFGAVGDGAADDSTAFELAVQAGGKQHRPVRIPLGRYRITRPIRLEYDNASLIGERGAVLVMDPPSDAPDVEAILVNRQGPGARRPMVVRKVLVSGLEVIGMVGAPAAPSEGILQLNACAECRVENVDVRFAGDPNVGWDTDGIVFARGSTGTIRDVRIENVPKAGVYVAPTAHDVKLQRVQVRSDSGPVGAAGILIAARDVSLRDCSAVGNRGAGLVLNVIPAGPGGALTSAAQVDVEGGAFLGNGGPGIVVSSAYPKIRPHDIRIARTVVSRNSVGVRIEAGSEIQLRDVTADRNGGAGIVVDSEVRGRSTPIGRINNVIISRPVLRDNGQTVKVDLGGILLRRGEQITISDPRFIGSSKSSGHQRYGIEEWPDSRRGLTITTRTSAESGASTMPLIRLEGCATAACRSKTTPAPAGNKQDSQ